MVDVSSQSKNINVTASSIGTAGNINVTPDMARYWSEKSKQWAISDRLIDDEDYSSKYYANQSKQNAQKVENTVQEVIDTANSALSDIGSAKDSALSDILDQEATALGHVAEEGTTQVDRIKSNANEQITNIQTTGTTQVNNVNTAGANQVTLATQQATIATEKANIATQQATIATNKAEEVVSSGNVAISNINEAKNNAINDIDTEKTNAVSTINTLKNEVQSIADTSLSDIDTVKTSAITSITNQETISKNSLIDEGSTQIGLIQQEGQTQISNIEQTGFYMRDGHLYYIDENGEEQEFVSGGGTSLPLFAPVIMDRVLTYEESQGFALQGTYVYKTAVAGERYGYPDFVNKCIEEKKAGTATQVTLGDNTITMYKNANGHQFYNIEDKASVDDWFSAHGVADFYGIDIVNERVFMPRNKWFMQLTTDTSKVNQFNEAGLPNITGSSTVGRADGNFTWQILNAKGAIYNTHAYTGLQDTSSAASGTSGLGFDASKSNPIYDNSDTVQPPSSNKLLYYIVGNTVSDTSWIDIVTQVEGGIADLANATNEGLAALANASNALRQTQITNCILEKPNNIHLELSNGVLTLKAGSIVIYPAGLNEDGSKKFDYYTVPNDLTVGTTGTWSGNTLVALNTDKSIGTRTPAVYYSGEAAPSVTIECYWYDTTNNLIKYKAANSSTWTGSSSFPIALITKENGTPKEIKQVLNGFGFIGGLVWVDKGVKVLIPDGRNEDGTLKNLEYTTTTLSFKNARLDYTTPVFLVLDNNGYIGDRVGGWNMYISEDTPEFRTGNYHMWYSPRDNVWYQTENRGETITKVSICLIASYITDGTRAVSMDIPSTISIVSQNDYYCYETPYFDIAASGLYTFSLVGQRVLSLPPEKRKVTMIGKVKTAENGYKVGDIIYPQFANYVGNTASSEIGSSIWISDKNLSIRFGNDVNFVHPSPNGAINFIKKANVQIKISVEGWLR